MLGERGAGDDDDDDGAGEGAGESEDLSLHEDQSGHGSHGEHEIENEMRTKKTAERMFASFVASRDLKRKMWR